MSHSDLELEKIEQAAKFALGKALTNENASVNNEPYSTGPVIYGPEDVWVEGPPANPGPVAADHTRGLAPPTLTSPAITRLPLFRLHAVPSSGISRGLSGDPVSSGTGAGTGREQTFLMTWALDADPIFSGTDTLAAVNARRIANLVPPRFTNPLLSNGNAHAGEAVAADRGYRILLIPALTGGASPTPDTASAITSLNPVIDSSTDPSGASSRVSVDYKAGIVRLSIPPPALPSAANTELNPNGVYDSQGRMILYATVYAYTGQYASVSVGSLPASAISFTPYGGISSTNVQSAIQELEDEKVSVAALASQTSPGATLVGLNANAAGTFLPGIVASDLDVHFDTFYTQVDSQLSGLLSFRFGPGVAAGLVASANVGNVDLTTGTLYDFRGRQQNFTSTTTVVLGADGNYVIFWNPSTSTFSSTLTSTACSSSEHEPVAAVTRVGGLVTSVIDVRRFCNSENKNREVITVGTTTIGDPTKANFDTILKALRWLNCFSHTTIRPKIIQVQGGAGSSASINLNETVDFVFENAGDRLEGITIEGVPTGATGHQVLVTWTDTSAPLFSLQGMSTIYGTINLKAWKFKDISFQFNGVGAAADDLRTWLKNPGEGLILENVLINGSDDLSHVIHWDSGASVGGEVSGSDVETKHATLFNGLRVVSFARSADALATMFYVQNPMSGQIVAKNCIFDTDNQYRATFHIPGAGNAVSVQLENCTFSNSSISTYNSIFLTTAPHSGTRKIIGGRITGASDVLVSYDGAGGGSTNTTVDGLILASTGETIFMGCTSIKGCKHESAGIAATLLYTRVENCDFKTIGSFNNSTSLGGFDCCESLVDSEVYAPSGISPTPGTGASAQIAVLGSHVDDGTSRKIVVGAASSGGYVSYLLRDDIYRVSNLVTGLNYRGISSNWVVQGCNIESDSTSLTSLIVNEGYALSGGHIIRVSPATTIDVSSNANWIEGVKPAIGTWAYVYARPAIVNLSNDPTIMSNTMLKLSVSPPSLEFNYFSGSPEGGGYTTSDYCCLGSFWFQNSAGGRVWPFHREGDIVYVKHGFGGYDAASDTVLRASAFWANSVGTYQRASVTGGITTTIGFLNTPNSNTAHLPKTTTRPIVMMSLSGDYTNSTTPANTIDDPECRLRAIAFCYHGDITGTFEMVAGHVQVQQGARNAAAGFFVGGDFSVYSPTPFPIGMENNTIVADSITARAQLEEQVIGPATHTRSYTLKVYRVGYVENIRRLSESPDSKTV